MKQKLSIILLLILTSVSVRAQFLAEPNKPYSSLDYSPGYVTINELTAGFKLKESGESDSKAFYGFTTIHGYQFDKNGMAGGGTGVQFYQGGRLIPVFMHIRYNFIIRPFTPYAIVEAGLLFDSNSTTNLFFNPGLGVMYAVSHTLGINLGACLLFSSGQSTDSFLNASMGVTYKPAKHWKKRRR